jgi:hypothetical protein
MFTTLIWFLRAAIYAGAIFTVVLFGVSGPELAAALGLALSEVASYLLGVLSGVFAASIAFGIPIVLLNINSNLAQAVVLLKTMQPGPAPGLIESVAPTILDHALDAWQSA